MRSVIALIRFAVTAVGLILIGVAVLVLLLFTQWDRVLSAGLERSMTYVFGAETRIESLSADPFTGVLNINGLTVMNPEGFEPEPAMTFERVRIYFDTPSLVTETPTIRLVRLEGGTVRLRHEAGRGSNIQALTRGRGGETAETRPLRGKRNGGLARRHVKIDRLETDGTNLNLSTNLLPVGEPSIEVAPLTLRDVSPEQPVSTTYLTAVFVRNLLAEAVGVRSILEPLMDALENGLPDMGEAPGESPNGAPDGNADTP